MAIENYLGNGIVGDSTGKGIVGSNTGRGIVGGNTNKGGGNSTENVGNIYMHPPYAVVVEPTNEGGNVTQGNKNYQATYNAYKAAAAKLVDQTKEALTAKAAWSTPPRVSIENGKLTLNGSDAFLKSNEAAQLRKTLKAMEGKTYNTEDLNKQIEAWNTALSEMSKGYLDTVDAMNQANYALSQSAENNEYHKLTISDMQKIGNSASIGKQPDAKTTKNKIFVGFEWDDDGNMKEKWVEAKDFYKEFNSLDDDEKRSAYHSLITQANNGDVGAYSKLTYLNGGSEGKPTNVEYDAVGDFFHTFGENLLTGLAEAADFVTTYIPVFNAARLTGRIVRAAGAGDINEFFKSDDIRNMIDDYEDVTSWENAYFSELTPGSTQAAAISGSVVGNVLGMAYSIWAGGVGNSAGLAVANAATQPIKLAIASANQSLVNSGKFVAFSRSTVTGAQGAMGGAVRTAGSVSNRFLIPTAIAEKFPNFSSALADTALKFSEMSGIGNTGATAAQALSGSEKAVTLVTNTVGAGANVVSKTSMVTLAGKTLAQEKAIATGIQTAFRLAPLAGEVALRHTDQYFQKLNAGEEVGELSDYVFENTVKDMAWGAAFMAAGAGFKKIKDVAKAAKKSPADAASAASYAAGNTQQGFYNDSHFTYDRGSNYLPSGLERDQDLQEFISTIMTVNGEGIYAVPNSSAPMTVSAVPGTNVAQESGKIFGAVSKNVIKQYEVEPVPDGANVVETVTNLDGTKTISKQHFDSIDEANDAVRDKTVPTTSPKTLANSDQVADIKVAPLAINGVVPEVLPEGVSQVKFEPGIVYRTPDALIDDIADLVDWLSPDRIYREYEHYVQLAQIQQADFEHINEAPDVPKEVRGADLLKFIRLAAWAKVHGYNAIPLRVPTSYSRTIKKFSMQDKFISKLADKYQLPELNAASLIMNSRGEENKNYYGTNYNGSLFYALPDIVPAINKRGTEYKSLDDEHKKAVDIIGALSLIFSADTTGHWDLLSDYGENRRAAIHNQGVYATLTNIRRAKDLAAFSGMSKENLAKAAQAYIHKFEVDLREANDGELSEKNRDELYNALTTLTDAINDGHAWFSSLSDGPESVEKKIEDYFNGVYNSDDALTKAAKTGTPLSSDIVVPVTKVGDNLIYKESEVKGGVLPTMYAHIPAGTKVAKRYSLTPEGNPIRTMQGGYYYDWAFDDSAGVARKEHSASSRNDDIYAEIEKSYGYDLKNAPFNVDSISLSIKPMLDKTPNAVGSKSLMEYYFADGDGYQAEVVLMSPKDYLDFLKRVGNMNEVVYEDIRDDSDTAKYTKNMANGDKFPMPALKFDQQGNYDGQEGRHRAFAAINNHINLIPVAIKYPAKENWFGRFAEQVGLPMVRMKLITPYVSDIITNNNPESKIVDLYYNHPNGAAYTPSQDGYDMADYGVYDRNSIVGMQKAARELLEPNKEVVDKNREQIKEKVTSLYTVTEPGGVVNRLNNRIRKQVAQGTLPKDSVSTRVSAAMDLLDSALETGDDGYGGWDGTPEPLLPETIDEISAGLESILLGAATDLNNTRGYRIDSPSVVIDGSPLYDSLSEVVNKVRIGRLVQGISRVANEEAIPDERTKQVIDNLYKEHGKKYVDEAVKIVNAIDEGGKVDPIVSYIQDVINIRQKLDDYAPNTDQLDIDADRAFLDRLKGELVDLVIKYNESLPTGFSKYMKPLSDGWGEKGSHNVKVDMVWDVRGIAEYGNQVNTGDGIRTRVQDLQVGEHVFWPSLDYGSFNLEVPNAYASGDGYNGPGHRYFVLTGSPKGTGLFFYGDPKNFGAHEADEHIHTNDGGALVHPMNMGATIVAIRELAPDATLIIQIRDNADGTPYSGPIDGQGGGVEKITERVRADETEITPNNIVGMQYGVPYKYFTNESDALAWAKEEGGRAVHKLDDNADILTRPPVTTDDLAENPLLLGAGEGYIPHVERFDELMTTLPTLMEEGEGAIDYLRGIVDIAREVNTVYTAVAANVNLDDIYSRYAKAIYNGEEVSLTPDEKKALEPITHMLDALGHYFDPSGKSLTQEFYLPTALAANKMVSIEKALLKGEDVDLEHPVDTGFNDILLDLQRIGDAGFWQKRTGDLFRDEDGNFTMARAGTLQDALTSYTVSALTRGKNSLAVAVNNEVAKSKYDRNRTQITEKQAYAGIKEADKIRGKTKSYRAAISKDADKIAELKEDYDESAVDQAMKAKNYSKDLGFVKSTNHAAQLLGYNQFLEMTPIQGSVIRYGTQGQVYRGTTSIRRKMEKINITGPMWVTRFGAKQRIGFGLEASEANTKKYGVFKSGEPAVNLGRIVSMNFDSDINALAYLYTLKGVIKAWSTGDGMDMVTAVYKYARENFPLLDDYEWNAAKLLKELARNYHASADPMAVDAMNVDSISKWIRDCTATCFNNAIMMTDISNLDERTLEALDEAAAYIYVGSPLKRNKVINGVLKWESVAKLGINMSPVLGNIVSEIFTRLPGYIGWKDTTRALKRALDAKEAARIRNIISDLPSHYDSPEDDTMLQTAKKLFGTFTDKAADSALKFLTWSENVKNLVYYAAGEINAERKGITDPAKKQLEAIRFVGEHAIAGGRGTAPGIAESSLGRTLFLFRTFTIRNFDDFIDFVEKASRGETGDNYWDARYEKKYGKNNKDRSGRNKASFKLGAKAVGGRLMRSYVIWLTILAYFGKSLPDALGGDPTGITDGGKDRGLYDDEDTDEYEGMTDFDNFINSLPAGVIFGSLQDLYFAARRRGVDSKQFMAFDLWNDQKLNNDMSKHLPLGVAYNRFADMLDLLDRGYSFSSTGKKTYAAPETALDVVKGFLFGKSTTENSLAYGKYRYGTVNIWGDLSSGDWMDFAMNANPLKDITGANAQFDTTRKDYTGVFDGSWNDIATMQLIIAQFKERQQTIISEYNSDKYRYGGDYEGLTDAEKVAKAKEAREKKIDVYTEDVQRAVNAFTDAGNALSDKQISNLMYLFDFHEGEEDDEWNSSAARERYVEAGLPDYNAATIQRTTKTEDGEKKDVTKNYLDRSLILQNAQQGFYGSSKKAANAVKEALSNFDSTYKAYKERVKALNDKYFAAREKNKKSAEAKQLSKDLEKLQNEYLDKLYQQLTPAVEQYGTALIGTYDVADVLADYMSNMIPYSSIKKYGQTYSSGNDIVYGQLAEWLQKRWGRNAPTAPSDAEVTNGISEIKKLLDQGKTAAAKSKARAILEKIGRGSLGARRYDVETLRDVAYD